MNLPRDALPAVAALLIAGIAAGGSSNATNTLTVTLAGQGGTIVSNPPGLSCSLTCTATFDSNAVVTLTASAAQGFRFVNWTTGPCTGGTAPSCEVRLDGLDREVAALFLPAATLQIAPRGPGAVTAAPAGLDAETGAPAGQPCAESDGRDDCPTAYLAGTRVTLTAAPDAGASFAGWSDPSCTGTGPCTITLAAAERSVVATFSPLTVNVNLSSDNARVTSSPPGIDCPNDCDGPFPAGSRVTLTATPFSGHSFNRWEYGCEPANAPTCVVTVRDQPTHAGLVLDNDPPPGRPGTISVRFEVRKAGDGSGRVTSTDLDCGPRCMRQYRFGDAAVLSAVADRGSRFDGWGGVCPPAPTCTLAVGPVTAIPAVFAKRVALSAALTRFAVTGRAASRRLVVTVQVSLATGAVVVLSRAGRPFASRTYTLRAGANVLRLAVPRSARAGPAQLRVGVQDPNGGVRNFRRTVKLPS
jgi:hypothetical protein